MKILNNEEMLNINGGSMSAIGLSALIGGAIIFLIGYFDGLIHPKKCN